MRGNSRSIAQRRAALRVERPDFEFWVVRAVNLNGSCQIARPGWTEDQKLDQVPVKGFLAGISAGSLALVQFQDGARNRPQVVALYSGIAVGEATSVVIPPLAFGLWPTAHGDQRLDRVTFNEQQLVDLTAGEVANFLIGEAYPGYSPLGLVVFENPDPLIAIYWPRKTGASLQMYLSTWKIDGSGSYRWETPIGPVFPPPSGQEWSPGLRQEWLTYCPQYKQFACIGLGSPAERNKVYFVSADGDMLGAYSAGFRLCQSSWGAGHFIKGWFSKRPPTGREGSDDHLLRAIWKNSSGNWVERWTFNPQELFPANYQLATSSSGEVISGIVSPSGRWPIDMEKRQVICFFSGSKKLNNGSIETVIQTHPPDSSIGSLSGYNQPDDARTKEQRAILVALNLDNGAINWTRQWIYTAVAEVDYDSIANFESFHTAIIGGSIGGLVARDHYPASGNLPYAESVVYSGLPNQGSIKVSPFYDSYPSCSAETGTPVYQDIEFPVVPWLGPNWGGAGPFTTPWTGAVLNGPVWDFFQPGHPCLAPFSAMSIGEEGPRFYWDEDNQHLKRLENVGGVLIVDVFGNTWTVHAYQKPRAIGNDAVQLEYLGHTETEVPAATPEQCNSWTDKSINWAAWMVPQVVSDMRLVLSKTGPNGSPDFDIEISQTTSMTGSGLQWSCLANVYEILVFPYQNRLIVVRDWFGAFEDSGNLENQAYPILEVREYDNPNSVIDRVPLLADFNTFLDESDPESPILRRVYDQYHQPETLKHGNGSSGQSDKGWAVWRHLVYSRTESQEYLNEVVISFDGTAMSVQRLLSMAGVGFDRPNKIERITTQALSGNRQIWSSGDQFGDFWVISSRSNQ